MIASSPDHQLECIGLAARVKDLDAVVSVVRWPISVAQRAIELSVAQTHVTFLESASRQEQLADLETQTLKTRKDLLEFRESHLQMTSPIDGIVLAGSLDRCENYSVTKGQILYEIAPLDQLRVEVGIPADEVMHVSVGDTVRLYFDGADTMSGTIEKIRPKAERRDQRNVFVAEVRLKNNDQSLRPGLVATAKIKTHSHPIAWILFHHTAETRRAAWF